MATTAQQALRVIGAEALTLMIAKPRDPANGDAVTTVTIADGVWFSDPAAGTPNTSFHGVLSDQSGVTIGQFLTATGQVTGPSELTVGSLTVDVATEEQEAWKDLDWNGAEFKIYSGARRRADGQLMVFSEFDLILNGLIDRADALGEAQWEIVFSDQRAELEEPLTKKFYRGFGGGFQVRGNAFSASEQSYLEYSGSSGESVGPEFTLEVIGRYRADPVDPGFLIQASERRIVQFNDDFGIWVNLNGEVSAFFGDGAEAIDSTHVLAEDEPFYAAVTVEADGVTVKVYAGTDADDVLLVTSGTLSTAVTSAEITQMRIGGPYGPSFDSWEVRLWSSIKAKEELEDLGDGPVTDAGDRSDLVESWRFGEGAELGTGPEIVFGEKSVVDLSHAGSGTPTWVSSYEGDDPDLWPGSPAGQTKARTWGPAKNVKMVQVDSQRPAYVWDIPGAESDPYRYVENARVSGVPMVRSHTLEANQVGEYVFDAATSTITIAIGGTANLLNSFKPFVPGQNEPARLGQRIKVSNTALNDGTFRVAVDGISDDGLVMTVVDGDLQDEDSPVGTLIESHPDDVQYTAYNEGSPQHPSLIPRIEMPSALPGDITADFQSIGGPGSFLRARWSFIHADLAGKTVDDSAVTLDPYLSYHLPAGDETTKKAALDDLARACFGWWIEDPSDPDTHLIGTWEPPSGSPVEHIAASRMTSVEPIKAMLPVGKFHVLHTPVWYQQNGDSLAESVSAGDRRKWSEPHTTKTVVNRRIRDTRFPNNPETPELETLLSVDSEITSFVELAKPFHFKEARWYRLVFPDLWALVFALNDVVTVSWDDPDLELDTTLVRITGRELNLSDGTMELEVFRLKDEPT